MFPRQPACLFKRAKRTLSIRHLEHILILGNPRCSTLLIHSTCPKRQRAPGMISATLSSSGKHGDTIAYYQNKLGFGMTIKATILAFSFFFEGGWFYCACVSFSLTKNTCSCGVFHRPLIQKYFGCLEQGHQEGSVVVGEGEGG